MIMQTVSSIYYPIMLAAKIQVDDAVEAVSNITTSLEATHKVLGHAVKGGRSLT